MASISENTRYLEFINASAGLLGPAWTGNGSDTTAVAQNTPHYRDYRTIVRNITDLEIAFQEGAAHIEIREHIVFTASWEASSNRATYRWLPELLDTEAGLPPTPQIFVPAAVQSLRGNCQQDFDSMGLHLEDWQAFKARKPGQCALVLHNINYDHSTSNIAFINPTGVRGQPLLLDNLYFRSGLLSVGSAGGDDYLANSATCSRAFWSDRDMYWFNVTVQGWTEGPGLMWTQANTLVADSMFVDWCGYVGAGIWSAAKYPSSFVDCSFDDTPDYDAADGVIEAYHGALVYLERVTFDQVTSRNAVNLLYSDGADDVATGLFYSDVERPVGYHRPGERFKGQWQSNVFLQHNATLALKKAPANTFKSLTSTSLFYMTQEVPNLPERLPGHGAAAPPQEAAVWPVLWFAASIVLFIGLLCLVMWWRSSSRAATVAGRHMCQDASTPNSEATEAHAQIHDDSGANWRTNPTADSAFDAAKHLTSTQHPPDHPPAPSETRQDDRPLSGLSMFQKLSAATWPTVSSICDSGTVALPEAPPPNAAISDRVDYVDQQLDSLRGQVVLGGLMFLPGFQNRMHGGQAVVQIAEDIRTRDEFAVKLYLSPDAFKRKAQLYEDPAQPLGRFLPKLRAIVAAERGGVFTDARGEAMPPCIVMERGEALNLWLARTGGRVDRVTALQVLTHVADRLRDIHAAGYAHRDVKPANIMWYASCNRWTLIDFGCAARTRSEAPVAFSMGYAAPEVLTAYDSAAMKIRVTEAMDAWAVGIVALELFSGRSVFNTTVPKETVIAQVTGQQQAPWEAPATAPPLLENLGQLRAGILSLVNRDPAARPSMKALAKACHHVLTG